MFRRVVVACFCLRSLYGVEDDSTSTPNSHLSFIYKEKQRENVVTRPKWDFLSELSDETLNSSFSFDDDDDDSFFLVPGSIGSTGPALTDIDTEVSLSSPNMSITPALHHAFGIMSIVKSHQNVLAKLYNPKLQGNEIEGQETAFDEEALDESQYIAQSDVNRMHRRPFFFRKRNNQKISASDQLPSGETTLLAHGNDKNDVWIDLFFEKLKYPPNPGFNTVHDTCLGLLVGYDRFISSGMLTGAVGYNHCKITESEHVAHGHQNQIFGVFHGTAYLPERMYLGYSLYGAVIFNNFHRFVNTGTEMEVARSSFMSYTLDPHINFGYDWCVNDWFIIEPFVSNDFLFSFQQSYSEEGAPGFNEHQDALNSGLYVVEPGVNLYQSIRRDWGLLVLRQEVGYKRVQPMFGTENIASIIDVVDGISVPTGLIDLNLFIFGFQIFSRSNQGLYADALYRGEWGNGLISNIVHLKLGYFF